MSNMKIISILDDSQRQQEAQIEADIRAAVVGFDEEIRALRADVVVEIQRLRNRLQDLTLRVTVLEGGNP